MTRLRWAIVVATAGTSVALFGGIAHRGGKVIHSQIGRVCLGPVAVGVPVGSPLPTPVPPLKLHTQVGVQVFAAGCHSSSERFTEAPTLREVQARHWAVEGAFTAEVASGPTLPDCGGGKVGRAIGWLTAGAWEISAGELALRFDVPADGAPVASAPDEVGLPARWRCASQPQPR